MGLRVQFTQTSIKKARWYTAFKVFLKKGIHRDNPDKVGFTHLIFLDIPMSNRTNLINKKLKILDVDVMTLKKNVGLP